MNIEGKIEECCGCSICAAVCPVKAITMKADRKGFEYPVVDRQKCIDCSKCVKFCDFKKQQERTENVECVYALQHKDRQTLKDSSSGGAFTALSDFILSEKGIVVGAVIDNHDFTVRHVCAETTEGRDAMRGSKYVQSSLKEAISEIEEHIEQKRPILFSGTPCQCAAIKSLFQKNIGQFYFVDLVCHGAMAPVLLQEDVKLWERKSKKKAVDYKFRDKKYGWEHTHTIVFSEHKQNSSIRVSQLIKLHAIGMRPSCYHCKYACKKREGDITIGDFWEAGKEVGICDHRGVSFITVNSPKGRKLIGEIRNDVKLIALTHGHIRQNAFFTPVKARNAVKDFWDEFELNGYRSALNKFAPMRLRSYVYQSVWRLLFVLGLDRVATRILANIQ